MLLSLFSGCGGLDLGFERAGLRPCLALERRSSSVASWNANRPSNQVSHQADLSKANLGTIEKSFGRLERVSAVVGGPPCQSFTRANSRRRPGDARARLTGKFISIALQLHRYRQPLDFIVMENVRELRKERDGRYLSSQIARLRNAGFRVEAIDLNALAFGVPQNRHRLFVIAIREDLAGLSAKHFLSSISPVRTVREAIAHLPDPAHFELVPRGQEPAFHPNHWCMTPRSQRFFDGSLSPGDSSRRSFKTLHWDRPSIAVSYGHREVHVHPNTCRRLSILESMLLQGFPESFVLKGSLSDQIDQVSEAVPPPLAEAVAVGVLKSIDSSQNQMCDNACSLSL